jgi:hypothetical protein
VIVRFEGGAAPFGAPRGEPLLERRVVAEQVVEGWDPFRGGVGRQLEHCAEGGVGVDRSTVAVAEHDPAGGAQERLAEPLLADPQGALGP